MNRRLTDQVHSTRYHLRPTHLPTNVRILHVGRQRTSYDAHSSYMFTNSHLSSKLCSTRDAIRSDSSNLRICSRVRRTCPAWNDCLWHTRKRHRRTYSNCSAAPSWWKFGHGAAPADEAFVWHDRKWDEGARRYGRRMRGNWRTRYRSKVETWITHRIVWYELESETWWRLRLVETAPTAKYNTTYSGTVLPTCNVRLPESFGDFSPAQFSRPH